MDPRLRTTLVTAIASVTAVLLGFAIADGSYFWPMAITVVLVATILVRLTPVPPDAILLGGIIVGYIVSNRGFAQLSPVSGVPLLPAEIALAVAVAWRGIMCAFQRQLPFRLDALNSAVLAWLILGTARVLFDVGPHGLMAVRDYAMIYYAGFFFLAQHMARNPYTAGYLHGCLLAAVAVLLPLYFLFVSFPSFFLQQLTVKGTPLIYYKDDIARIFLVVGSFLLFHWASGRQRYWAWPLAVAMFVYVAGGDNRASLVAGILTCGLLLAARRWHFPALQAGATAVGLLLVVILAGVFANDWAERKLAGVGDRLASLTDIHGTGRYVSEDSFNKGDNNRFRFVWWRNVAEETWQTNPVFGLGFGADLAGGFVQEYYPNAGEEFNTRSPHNIFLTIFGRMGLAGVAVWVVFCFILLRRTWFSLRHREDPVSWSFWASAWVVLLSACLGVVLEGPMGAVIFWTLLGLAHARDAAAEETPAAEVSAAPPEPALVASPAE